MQSVSVALQAELDKGQYEPRVLIDLLEFYASNALPSVDGFNSTDAVKTFASQAITWDGIAYRREFKVRGEISRSIGEKTNSVSLQFSNISRYMATWAQTTTIEGMILVVRCVSPTVTDDALVLFVGRCEKPGDIDKGTFDLAVRQDFGNINVTLPTSQYVADDPNGYLPGDLLYEGIRFVPLSGLGAAGTTTVPSKSFFGRLFGRTKRVPAIEQWSSLDFTPYGQVIREIFGMCQVELQPIMFKDTGYWLEGLWASSKGPIQSVTNIQLKNFTSYGLFDVQTHTGEIGGTGATIPNHGSPYGLTPQTGGNSTEDFRFPGSGLFSRLSFTGISILHKGINDEPEVISEPPVIVGLVMGRKIDVPNGLGVYSVTRWSNNGVHISRFILTNERFTNINTAFMEDSVGYLTSLYCDEPLIDETNSQVIAISEVEENQAGESFVRYQTSGKVIPDNFDVFPDIPDPTGGPYTPIPTTTPSGFVTQPLLVKRYVTSFPITEEVRAVDLLYKTIFPSFKGFMRVNKRGKYEIHTEKPASYTRLRSSTIVGATSLPVLDVTPWKTGPELLIGRLLIGVSLTTSEVRDILSAVFSTSGNSITLVGSATGGGASLTASGATLSGGSTSVQASATLTVGGTPAAGNTITATIDGVAVRYVLTSDDTTETAAGMLAAYINATPRLKPYIKAFWDSGSPTVITVKCLHGALNLSSTTGFPTLLLTHTGPIADPLTAPTVAASSGGSLAAGVWKLAYADVTSIGLTALTPLASITVTANQKIDVSGLPALTGTARNFYLSQQAGSTVLKYVTQRMNASNFSISAAPLPNAIIPPSSNTTGEELVRIAGSFATNSQDVYSAWPVSTLVLLSDIYLPTVLNGHKYQVTTGGTTGSEEPTWPTTAGATVTSGTAVFTEIGTTVLAQAGLTRANIIKDSFKWPLGGRQSSVNQIKGNFRDNRQDFALTPFKVNDKAKQLQVGKVLPKEVDYSAVDNLYQVLRLANGELAKNVDGDWFDSFGTGPNGLTLEEGDLVCCSDDSGGLINVLTRIEDMRIRSNHEVFVNQARKYSTNQVSDDAGASVIPIPSTLRYIQTVDSLAVFIDSFAIRGSDALVAGFYIAVSRDLSVAGDWRGWKLHADYGDGYVALPDAFGDIPATVGIASSTLGTVADPTVFDTVSSLDFTLKYGAPDPAPQPFETVTEADLIANPYKNLFHVGPQAGGEYLQAATVVNHGNQSYTISDFYRGRFGTDTTELTHGADEDVVFLNGAEKFVAIDPARLDTEYNYKVVTTNQNVADADPIPFTWTGGTFAAKRVTEFSGVRDSSGNWHFSGVGHPRELPAYYNLRVRRPVDDVVMRDIPIATGVTQAAVFGDTFGDIAVTNNNLATDTVDPFEVMGARTSQEITEPGAFLEFILPALDTLPGGSLNLAFFHSDDPDWTDTSAWTVGVYTARFTVLDVVTGEWSISFWDVGGEDAGEELLASFPLGLGKMKIRLTFSGTELRVYKNWANTSTEPLVISKVPPVEHFPMKAAFYLATGAVNSDAARVEQIVIGGMVNPNTIYSKAQQDHDDPVTDMVTSDAEIWETGIVPGRSVRKEFP